jgi:hypothetical protein|nr:MAG TPA: hypothetical protein [Caudoviricetes sp.]
MIGKFIGRTSRGFIKGSKYDIRSEIHNNGSMPYINIYDKNSNAWCPYQSLESVMKNWIFYYNWCNK